MENTQPIEQQQTQDAPKKYETSLVKISNTFLPMITDQLTDNGINLGDYAKSCVMNAITSMNELLDGQGIDWNDPQLDKNNINKTLLTVASLELNPAANPREVYFQIRRVKTKKNGRDEWRKQIEMGIEGDGNDAILSRFGRGVQEVRQYWQVRENDGFEYPTFNGLELDPPKWQPKGTGKVVRVVYPIIKTSGVVEFHIAERADVIQNLIAHVKNNLMNETFGIAKNRYSATTEQKKQMDQKRDKILEQVEAKGLDGALDDPELAEHISPAWKDPQSRESMIIRKMRNNITKRIPKDFGNSLAKLNYQEATDETRQNIEQEIDTHANSEILDMDDFSSEDDEIPAEDFETPQEADFKELEGYFEQEDEKRQQKNKNEQNEEPEKQPAAKNDTKEAEPKKTDAQMSFTNTGNDGTPF